MSFLKKAIGGFESVVRDVSGNKDYHFGDLTKKALGIPTHSDEEKQAALNDWIVLRDVSSGRTYYQNNRLGITQWDPPVPLQSRQQQQPPQPQQPQQLHPAAADQALPAGWQTLHDAHGRPYVIPLPSLCFCNTLAGTTPTTPPASPRTSAPFRRRPAAVSAAILLPNMPPFLEALALLRIPPECSLAPSRSAMLWA